MSGTCIVWRCLTVTNRYAEVLYWGWAGNRAGQYVISHTLWTPRERASGEVWERVRGEA